MKAEHRSGWETGLFFLLTALLGLTLLWQLHALFSLISFSGSRAGAGEEADWDEQCALLYPTRIYYTSGDGRYAAAFQPNSEYDEMKQMAMTVLDRARVSGSGRSITEAELWSSSPACCLLYDCPLEASLLQALGFSGGLCQALPEEGIRELWLLPSSLYWQDSVLVLVNRSAGFFWRLTVAGPREEAGFQPLLDRFFALTQSEKQSQNFIYFCAQESLGLGGDAFFLAPDLAAPSSFGLARSYGFSDREGSLNTTQAEAYALRLFQFSDTMRVWSSSFSSVLYTNEYATLRVSSDGKIRYSAMIPPGGETASLPEAYQLARDFAQTAALPGYSGSGLSLSLRSYENTGDAYRFSFDYYFRGVRLLTDARDEAPVRVTVSRGSITGFAAEYVSVYQYNQPTENGKAPTQYDMLLRVLSEYPGALPELCWELSGSRFSLCWKTGDARFPVTGAVGEEVRP